MKAYLLEQTRLVKKILIFIFYHRRKPTVASLVEGERGKTIVRRHGFPTMIFVGQNELNAKCRVTLHTMFVAF